MRIKKVNISNNDPNATKDQTVDTSLTGTNYSPR